MTQKDSIRTAIRDAVLANVSEELTDGQVQAVEFGAIEDTRAVCLDRTRVTVGRGEYVDRQTGTLLDFEEYAAVMGAL